MGMEDGDGDGDREGRGVRDEGKGMALLSACAHLKGGCRGARGAQGGWEGRGLTDSR